MRVGDAARRRGVSAVTLLVEVEVEVQVHVQVHVRERRYLVFISNTPSHSGPGGSRRIASQRSR